MTSPPLSGEKTLKLIPICSFKGNFKTIGRTMNEAQLWTEDLYTLVKKYHII